MEFDIKQIPNLSNSQAKVLKPYEALLKLYENPQHPPRSSSVCNTLHQLATVLYTSDQPSYKSIESYLENLTTSNKDSKKSLLYYTTWLYGDKNNIDKAIGVVEDRILSGEKTYPSFVKLLKSLYSVKSRAEAKKHDTSLSVNDLGVDNSIHCQNNYKDTKQRQLDLLKSSKHAIQQLKYSKNMMIILYTNGTVDLWNMGYDISTNQNHSFDTKIVSVSCGSRFAMVLNEAGSVLVWGEPYFNKQWWSGRVKEISAGGGHCAAVTRTGGLYTWGISTFGRLGHGFLKEAGVYKEHVVREPKLVEFFADSNVKVRKAVAGGMHTAVLTEDGQLYTMGFNHRGQLGYGDLQVPHRNEYLRSTLLTFIPHSTIDSAYKEFFNKPLLSDLQIKYDLPGVDKPEPIYLHTLILYRANPALLGALEKLKKAQVVTLKEFFTTLSPGIKTIPTAQILIIFLRIIYGFGFEYYRNEGSQLTDLCKIIGGTYCDQIKNRVYNSYSNLGQLVFGQEVFPNFQDSAASLPLSDITLEIGKTRVSSHRIILAARSSQFAKLIEELKEGETTLKLEDSPLMEPILRYLYYDSFKLDATKTSGDDILKMIQLCNVYQVHRLKAGCEKLIVHSVDKSNVIPILSFAIRNNANNLVTYAVDFINKGSILSDSEVFKLPAPLQHSINSGRFNGIFCGGQYTPRVVEFFAGKSLVDVAAGDKLTVVQDNQGNLFQVGIGSNHKPGLPNIIPIKCFTKSTDDGSTDSVIESIAAGSSHAAVLMQDGQVYAWGAGFLGQVGPKNTFYSIPQKIDNPNLYNSLTCGSHSTILYNDNIIKQEDQPIEIEKELRESFAKLDKEQLFDAILNSEENDMVTLEIYQEILSLENLTVKLNIAGSDTASQSSQVSQTSNDSLSNVNYSTLKVSKLILTKEMKNRIVIDKQGQKSIRIYGFSVEEVKCLVMYLYSGKVSVDGDQALNVMVLAFMFGARNLSKIISGKVIETLTPQLAAHIHNTYLVKTAFMFGTLPKSLQLRVNKYLAVNHLQCSKFLK